MLLAAMSAGDKLSVGGITSLLGLGMTFIVLAILIGLIILMEKGLKSLQSFLEKKKSSSIAIAEVTIPTVIEESVKTEIDEKTMAAITEAVAMFSQYDDKDKKPHNNIVIKSVTEIE